MARFRVAEKSCPSCGVIKPRTEFYLHNGNITYAKCKLCLNLERRSIYNDPVEGAERRRASRVLYEKRKAKGIDKEAENKRKLRWARENRDRTRAAYARWYAVESNRKKARAWISAAKRANPEARLRDGHKRRARKRGNGGSLSKGIIGKLLKLQKHRCACCYMSLRMTGHHLDHIRAISKGGMNVDSNVQLLCPKCNLQKHVRDSIDFMQSKGFLL